jgi:hypothetical protein
LLLHFVGTLVVACALKFGGRNWYVPGLFAATVIHCLYNLYFIMGWIT